MAVVLNNNHNPCCSPRFLSGLTLPTYITCQNKGEEKEIIPEKQEEEYCCVQVIDLSNEDVEELSRKLVQVCEEDGVFKVINHGVHQDLIRAMENAAHNVFALPMARKEMVGPTDPFGYGNRSIGPHGDTGFIEYLLLNSSSLQRTHPLFGSKNINSFRKTLDNYIKETRRLASRVLELLAIGLGLKSDAFTRYVESEGSDWAFRLNHYPAFGDFLKRQKHSAVKNIEGVVEKKEVIGFGEHSDPQILTVLHSNDVSGLQVMSRDGKWSTIQHDDSSFSINVGDCLQVLSNGRFRSVWHRAVANRYRSRYSMMLFAAPHLDALVEPLALPKPTEENPQKKAFRSFKWRDYKEAVYRMTLGSHPLDEFRA